MTQPRRSPSRTQTVDQPIRAAIYARISEDDTGLEKGVTRQVDDCQALADQRDMVIVGMFIDNDVSAFTGKPRQRYADLLRLVEAGEVDVILCWQTSRLLRNRRERAEAIELLQKHRVSVLPEKGQALDMSTAQGRSMAAMLGEFDTLESDVKSERVQRAAEERAAEGRANGAVAYGWKRNYVTDDRGKVLGFNDVEHPEHAAIVREIVRRLLREESLDSIAADLTKRGIPTPRDGSKWLSSTVRKLALRPNNIALRIFHRGKEDETYFKADWPAIVKKRDHDAVTRLLNDPGRQSWDANEVETHLLTVGQIGICGVCEGSVRVQRRRSQGLSLYTCHHGHVGRSLASVDELVEAEAIELLQRKDLLEMLADDDQDARDAIVEARKVRDRMTDAADAFSEGEIDRLQLKRINTKLKPELARLERVAARHVPEDELTDLEHLAGPAATEVWFGFTTTQKRRFLQLLRFRVVILPTTKGPGFKPESVRIEHIGTGRK
jgi:DNA invertase Pin-like site-specific DNA recombinase